MPRIDCETSVFVNLQHQVVGRFLLLINCLESLQKRTWMRRHNKHLLFSDVKCSFAVYTNHLNETDMVIVWYYHFWKPKCTVKNRT